MHDLALLGPLDWLKSLAVIVTAVFGIIGSLTESRDKATGKLTHWAWISVLGVVVSAGIAAFIQTSDAIASNVATRKQAERTASLIENSSRILEKTNRNLTRLGATASYRLQLDGDCRSAYWRSFCATLPTGPAPFRPLTSLQFARFASRAMHFQITISKPSFGDPALIYEPADLFEAARASQVQPYKNGFSISIDGTLRLTSGNASTSTADLHGYSFYFYSDEPVVGHTRLTQLVVDFESGQQLYMDDGTILPVDDRSRRSPHTLNFKFAIPGDFFGT